MEKRRPTNLRIANSIQKNHKKFPGFHNPISKKDEWSNFKEWKSVHHGCVQIFHGKKLSNNDFEKIFEIIRSMSSTEVGLTYMVSKNYEEAILKRGMIILREEIKEKPGHQLLARISDIWTKFYSHILPTLQILFYSIPTHGLTVRQMTLLSFRDVFLLKTKIEDALNATDGNHPKGIKQMLLVLQAVKESPLSENYYKLEALTAKVVNPYLGAKGLYVRTVQSKEATDKNTDRYSVISSASSNCSSLDSPDSSAKAKAIRPMNEVSRPVSGNSSDDGEILEELMNYRRQKWRGAPQKLSCVEESYNTVSESLASVLADGFDVG